MDWIRLQIKSDLAGITADQVKKLVIAYEPIWAIGTGKTATADQAQEVCKGIRDLIAEIYNEETAEAVRIQYGGSMNAGNAKNYLQNLILMVVLLVVLHLKKILVILSMHKYRFFAKI